MDNPHREFCRKQHRVLGHFLAVLCWCRGLDCIVVDRDFLRLFLGIWQFKEARLDWLREDLKPWFRHQELYYYSGSTPASIFFSRVAIEEFLPSGRMTDERRVELMPPGAPRAATLAQIFQERGFRKKVANIERGKVRKWKYIEIQGKKVYPPLEEDIVSYLALLAAGLRVP